MILIFHSFGCLCWLGLRSVFDQSWSLRVGGRYNLWNWRTAGLLRAASLPMALVHGSMWPLVCAGASPVSRDEARISFQVREICARGWWILSGVLDDARWHVWWIWCMGYWLDADWTRVVCSFYWCPNRGPCSCRSLLYLCWLLL